MLFVKRFANFKNIYSVLQVRSFHKNLRLFKALEDSPNAELDKNIFDRYMCLPIPECKVQTTYIWIDGTGINLRNKSRTLDTNPSTYKDLPLWTFNGFNSLQATITQATCYLVPVAMYNDPIRRGKSKLVLCETFDANEKPSLTNHRQKCIEALNKVCDQEVEIGFEQEYIFMGMNGRPLGWPKGEPIPSEGHYAGVGAGKVYGREIIECFYRACLYCGIDIFSENPEALLGQWEFKTPPILSIKAADDLWMARWLLVRIAEDFGVDVSFNPKFSARWHGSALHVNFSTKRMREDGGYKHIEDAIKKLEKSHKNHLKVYGGKDGEDIKKRLVGQFQSSSADKFTWGISDRTVSVKISPTVAAKKKGYFEDRRPGANADPYQVIEALVRTICL